MNIWSSLDRYEKISKLVLKRKSQSVSVEEWKLMNHYQRVSVMCIERYNCQNEKFVANTTNNIEENETKELIIDHSQLKYKTYFGACGVINYNFNKITFENYISKTEFGMESCLYDFKLFYKTNTLKKLNENGVTSFEIISRKLDEFEWKYYFEKLCELKIVEKISFFNCSFSFNLSDTLL